MAKSWATFVAQVLKRFKKNLRNAGIDITENIHILSTNDITCKASRLLTPNRSLDRNMEIIRT